MWRDGSPEGCRTLLLYISEVTCVHCCFRDCITIHFLPQHWMINWSTKSNFYVGVALCMSFSSLNIIRSGCCIHCRFICEENEFIAGNFMTFITLLLQSYEYMAVQEFTLLVKICSPKHWYVEHFPHRENGESWDRGSVVWTREQGCPQRLVVWKAAITLL